MSGSVTGIIHDRSSSQSPKKIMLIESAVKKCPNRALQWTARALPLPMFGGN